MGPDAVLFPSDVDGPYLGAVVHQQQMEQEQQQQQQIDLRVAKDYAQYLQVIHVLPPSHVT